MPYFQDTIYDPRPRIKAASATWDTILSMTTFVQIVVNVPAVAGIFDYSVPDSLLGQVGVGHLVVAPFGKQTVQGVVFRFIDQPSVPEVKEILQLVDSAPVM